MKTAAAGTPSLMALVAQAKAFVEAEPVMAAAAGVLLLLAVVTLYTLLSSPKKGKKVKMGSTKKTVDGMEVRRSTRTPKAPKRWDPTGSPTPEAASVVETPTTTRRRAAAKALKDVTASPKGTPSPRVLRSRASRA